MSKKICQIVTVSMTVDQFLRFAFQSLCDDGFEVHLICNMDEIFMKTLPDFVIPHPVSMERGISISGFKAMIEMFRIFKSEKFDLVQYSTPNASFYASIASYFAKVPVRLYCQWGLVYVSFSGVKKIIFKTIERIVCALSTDVQPDSFGNLNLCRRLNFYNEKKSRVVWNGSANGVDLNKFDIEKKEDFRYEIRSRYNFSEEDVVIGFLGRLMKDKGCDELIGAYQKLENKYNNLRMLFVGPTETTGTENQSLIQYFEKNERIIKTGNVPDPQRYLAAMDIFAFPSYREGFGSAVIEAEAMGVPVVISDIPGPTDGIIENETGLIVEKANMQSLLQGIETLIKDENMRYKMGHNAHHHVVENFDAAVLVGKIIENRNWLIDRNKK